MSLAIQCGKSHVDEVAQKKRDLAKRYADQVRVIEKNYQVQQFDRKTIDELRFIKVTMLGEEFGPDSLHLDSLVCYSEAYQVQQLWEELQEIDYAVEYPCDDAHRLISRIRDAMRYGGCLYGGLGPTPEQLKMMDDSCFLYEMKAMYHRAVIRADSNNVAGYVETFIDLGDSLSNFLNWLGTNREELLALRRKGWRNEAIRCIRQAYADVSVKWVNEYDNSLTIEAQRCSQEVGMSVEELATESDVPISWIYKVFGTTP
ncbi:MAG: hypothetical protein WC289_03075 [Patescibacteria group bacterium]